MPHECCARRLLQTRNVGVMCLCCQDLKHGRVGFRLKQRSVKSTTTKKKTKNKHDEALRRKKKQKTNMMKIAVGILFHVQGDYFQCSTATKILIQEHSYVRRT